MYQIHKLPINMDFVLRVSLKVLAEKAISSEDYEMFVTAIRYVKRF